MASIIWTQGGFRAYSDGTEAGSVAIAAENTNWTQACDANFLLRLNCFAQISGSGLTGGTKTVTPKLQYSSDAGTTWNDVNAASSKVRSHDSTNIADGAATTNRLALHGIAVQDFVAGNYDEVDGACAAVTLGISQDTPNDDNTELLFCVQVRSVDVANSDLIRFRLVETSGTLLGAYNVTPILTVSKPSATKVKDVIEAGGVVVYNR